MVEALQGQLGCPVGASANTNVTDPYMAGVSHSSNLSQHCICDYSGFYLTFVNSRLSQ